MRNPFSMSLQQHLMAGAAIAAVAVASPAVAQTRQFNVPAQRAATGIQQFARQAGVQILADGNIVGNRRTNTVRGAYSVDEGLRILLSGTGLTAESAGPGGIITVRANPASQVADSGNAAGIVVTGSRIRTNEFNSPSPITVVTAEQAQLRGETDIASLLQSVPAASGSPQIGNNASATVTGSQMPNALGGNGANTLDLRGLGPQRTLFLINGKRMGPAGTSGQVAPVDMNQLGFPQSQLERVEILLDGASSIYGSDAIGGVVNIITKTKYNGGALRVYASPTQHGGGNRYQVDGSYGKSWSNAYINGGFSWYKQTAQTWGQRDWSACASDDVTRADGSDGSVIDPRTGKDKCKANGLLGPIIRITWPGDKAALNYTPDPTAIYRGGVLGRDINGWKNVGTFVCNNASYSYAVNNTCNNATAGGYNVAASLYSQGLYPYELRDQLKNSLRAPVERYMADVNAGLDLSPSAQIYTNLLFTRRDSSQYRTTQFSPSISPNNIFNPGFVTNGSTILAVVPRPTEFSQRVDYYRAVLGVKGDLGDWAIFHNWNYDLYGQYALSRGTYTTNSVLLDRYNAVRNTPLGCDVNQGGAASMATLEPGVACVPVNWFAGVANNGLTSQELAFLTSDETSKTTYRHAYIEASASGDLFKLPGGPLGAAVGFQVRRESIDDLPSYNIQLGNLFNALPVERTRGYDLVEELFGELRAPLLRDVPLIHSLVITGSGRMSHYRSFGTNFTYKAGIDWELTKWLALRATQGTGFRAPALYELFLGDTQGYIGFSDPCYEWGNSTDPNIRKNCAASGIPEDWENPRPGIQTHSAQGGGFGHVKAETSLMRTAGVVLSAKPLLGIDLQVAADYFTTEINNEIGQFGASGILAQCYGAKDSIDTNVFCGLFTRSPTDHFVTDVYDYYVNLNQAIFHGLDASIRFRQDISHDTHFTLQSSLSRTLKNTIQYFAQNAPVDNLGKIGYPKFTGNVNLRLDHGPWTLNWFTNVIGRVNNYTIADLRPNYAFPAIAVTAPGLYPNGVNPVYVKHSIGIYTVSDLSIRRVFPSFTITAGVQNVFDKDPPLISDGGGTRTGQAAYASQYDLAGRTFFIDLTKKF